ncbi:MAG: hypothetical protein C0601_12195 [Candidatus Muiribacterium halophilum]|uniref:Uncharacterized protein n=1 Tax=Muiribacterium halophilum TaxID=2053465 RepID=A0A2N5ZAP6_MUIH1|nr:MAG: hypothetical protein C0601_12195 [Candidatus Muirbacterium halophilum]
MIKVFIRKRWVNSILFLLILTLSANSGVMLDAITKYEMSVRANGMGDAFTAFSDDASGIMYNPAGLADVEHKSLLFVHDNRFGLGIDENFMSFSMPWKKSNLTMSFLKEGVDGIPITDASKNIIGYTDTSKTMFSFGYARRLTERARLGGTFKLLSNDLSGFKGSGYSFDLGGKYKLNRKFDVGLNLQDILSSFEWDSGRDEDIPLTIKAGIGYTSTRKNFKVGIDLVSQQDADSYYAFGGEYKVSALCNLRAGFKDGEVTMGLVLAYDNWEFDYAYMAGEVEDNNVISATMNLKKFFTAADREIERYRDGKIVRKARVVPQDRNGGKSDTIPASDPIKAVLDKYSDGNNTKQAEEKEKEIQMVKKSLEIPEEAKMHYRLGNTFVLNEVFTSAISEYKKAIEIFPEYAVAHYNLGALYEKMGIKEKAIYEYQLVMQIDPYNVNAYISLGNLYLAMDNVNEALKHYNKVIIIAPGSETARLAAEKIRTLRLK